MASKSEARRSQLLVVGSINSDVTYRVANLPHAGETVTGLSRRVAGGGKGANQAAAASRCTGVETTLIAALGDDLEGRSLVEEIAGYLPTAGLQIVPSTETGRAVILVDEVGENSIVIFPGANEHLTIDAPATIAAFSTAAVVLLQLESPIEVVTAAAERAKAGGVLVVLNAAPQLPIPERLWEAIDILVVNEGEGRYQAEVQHGDIGSVLDRLVCLVPEVVLTRGREGCDYRSRKGDSLHLPALSVEVVDTSGAGDTFCGTFAGALALGEPRVDALRLAVAAASLSVQFVGARGGLPSRVEIEQFVQSDPRGRGGE